MIRRYLILSVFAIQTLAGCSFIYSPKPHPEALRAQSLLQSGKNKEASVIYKQLADVPSGKQNDYRLLAADALLRANEVKDAKEYLDLVNVNKLEEDQLNHFHVLQAQVDLSQGNAEQALTQLKAVQVELLNSHTKRSYYQSLAFAYSLTGNAIQSVQALINLEPFIYGSKARNENHEQILATLRGLSAEDLQDKQQMGNPLLNGWMELARVFKLDEGNFDNNLAKWKRLYPTHPANSAFLTAYVKKHQRELAYSGLIAVFLPQSGSFAEPAKVIKTGLMKAYNLAQKNNESEREIRFYDTETANSMASLYQRAVKDGARLVVGPLDKKDIKALVDTVELTIPVLALNHVEGLTHSKLYQFALSPIDDAAQVTMKARRDGRQKALFFVPSTEQGKRFAGYFTDNWQKQGGQIVTVQEYDDKGGSEKLAQTITENVAGDAADSIILNAYAKPARTLYPVLQQNSGLAKLPVYATSHVYLGDVNAVRDKVFDGVTFCDVPWVFPQAYKGELSKAALQENWQSLSSSYLRLLPMGIDAYQLISELGSLKDKPYSGATGRLRLDNTNRVTRELFCAKFIDGVPRALNFSTESTPIEPLPVSQPHPVDEEQKAPTLPALPELI